MARWRSHQRVNRWRFHEIAESQLQRARIQFRCRLWYRRAGTANSIKSRLFKVNMADPAYGFLAGRLPTQRLSRAVVYILSRVEYCWDSFGAKSIKSTTSVQSSPVCVCRVVSEDLGCDEFTLVCSGYCWGLIFASHSSATSSETSSRLFCQEGATALLL